MGRERLDNKIDLKPACGTAYRLERGLRRSKGSGLDLGCMGEGKAEAAESTSQTPGRE